MAAEQDGVRRVGSIYVRVPAVPSRRVPPLALACGAALGVLTLVRLGVTPHGVLAAGLLVVLTAAAAVDARAHVLPNRLLGPALAAVLAWQLAFAPARWVEWLVAGLGAGVFMLLPSLLRPGAIGMGDVKLAVLLGLALGSDVMSALAIGFLSAAPVALVLLLHGDATARRATMPYGPFLALGAAVVLLA